MRAARTEFVSILLGDDLWAEDAVEVLERNLATRPDVDFFHSARRIIDDHGAPISGVAPPVEDVSREHFLTGAPVKHLLCWRRELGLSIGGIDESLNSVGPDDYDFPWSMAEAGARFGAVPECLYVYRDHRSGFRLTTHLSLRTPPARDEAHPAQARRPAGGGPPPASRRPQHATCASASTPPGGPVDQAPARARPGHRVARDLSLSR